MASEENIKVAVRLRPFLPNLKNEADGKAKRIVRMDEISSSVCLQNPGDSSETHKFTFDSVLWSFDGYSEADGYLSPENKAASDEVYCDQKQVYDDVGKEIVQNLWNGYNGTIFTFGEGKSGKSWTLLGTGANKGIVSQSLTELFKGVREKEKQFQQNGSALEVRLSMAEIYNERVKDLLLTTSASSQGSNSKLKNVAKIREHSKKGFYIEGLRNVLLINHEDIQQRLEEGLLNRAVFLTSINATSSYSTTYISVTLVQRIRNHRGDEVTRVATLEFIDLPACEFRLEDTEERNDLQEEFYFDEGSTTSSIIMKSVNLKPNGIDCLSNCVDLLIEASIGKYTDTIPFYKHSLTKIMRNAFLGNTKSYMIATISPSEFSFKNSLFVLKLAEKVRMLTTRSVPNEEVTSKLIRELKTDSDKIRKLISLGELETNADLSNRLAKASHMSPSERDAMKRKIVEDMKAQLRENEKEIRNLQQSFEERLKPFKTEKNDLGRKIENDRKSKCHILNLNQDSQISGKIIHIIPLGTIDFGQNNVNNNSNTKGKENGHFITFTGPGILEHHGTFTYNTKDGKFSIKPNGPKAKIFVNEVPIQFDTVLGHNDVVILGGMQVWLYQNPKETWLEKFPVQDRIYWEGVMEDVAMKSEDFSKISLDCGNMPESLQTQLLNLIPSLEDARVMISDLNQNFTLHPILQHPVEVFLQTSSSSSSSETMRTEEKSPKLLVKVENTADGTFHYWSIDKFQERLELLRDSYAQYLEDGDIPLKEIGAFKERSDLDMPIGYSIISLEPLAYQINIENSQVAILDYITFEPVGSIGFSLVFCEEISGEKVNDEERFIESPDELLDEKLTILMGLQDLRNVTLQFKDIYCKYTFLDEDEDLTKYLDSNSKSSNFGGTSNRFERKFFVGPVTDNTLNLMLTQNLILRFYGKQRAHKLLNLMGSLQNSTNGIGKGSKEGNPVGIERTKAQLKIKEKAEQRHHRRLNAMKALLTQSESLGEELVPLSVMKSVVQAKSQKLVDMSLEEHKDALTFIPEEPPPKQLPPELKALKRFSEICCIV